MLRKCNHSNKACTWCCSVVVCHQFQVRSIRKIPFTGEFIAQRPVTRSFGVFFDLRLHEWLSKQSWGWWFETPSCTLWRRCDAKHITVSLINGYLVCTSICFFLIYMCTHRNTWCQTLKWCHMSIKSPQTYTATWLLLNSLFVMKTNNPKNTHHCLLRGDPTV